MTQAWQKQSIPMLPEGSASGASFTPSLADRSENEILAPDKPNRASPTVDPPAGTTVDLDGSTAKQRTGESHRSFPYIAVAQMWAEGKSAKQIATAIGRLDGSVDPAHKVRSFLTRMHTVGYIDASGQRVKLPYRAAPGRDRPKYIATGSGAPVEAEEQPAGLQAQAVEVNSES